jgi:putative membrane protein
LVDHDDEWIRGGGICKQYFPVVLIASILVLPGIASARLTHRDIEYMDRIAQNMQSEMELARLAHTHATQERVRRFARWILTDNSREYRTLRQLAQAKGVQLPMEPSVEQRELAKKLAQMKDPKFSRRYLSHEIKDHQTDAHLTARILRSTRDRHLRDYAHYYLSSTRGHLRLAEAAVVGQISEKGDSR